MPDDEPITLSRGTKPASSTGRLIAVSLVTLAVVIRLAPAFVLGQGWPPARGEARVYLDFGRSLAEGHGFSRPAVVAGGADRADAMPGYPVLVAAADWTGLQMRALVVLQALAGAGALVLALVIGLRLAGVWAGIVAAALLVFDPLQVVFCDTVSPQVPVSLALAVMAAAGLKFILADESTGGPRSVVAANSQQQPDATERVPPTEGPTRRAWLWAAAAGAALATAAYFDWAVLGLVVVVGLAALVGVIVKRRWRLLGGWAVGLAVVAVCLAPWVARNNAVLGRPVLVTSAGLQLLDGFWPDTNDPQDVALRQKLADPNLPGDEVGLDRLCFAIVAERIGERPGRWLGQMVQHAGDMWTPAVPSAGPVALPAAVGYASLLPAAVLALAGLWVLRRRPAVLVWLLMVPVGLTLSHMAFAAGPPDRIAAMPLVAVLGGVGLASVLKT